MPSRTLSDVQTIAAALGGPKPDGRPLCDHLVDVAVSHGVEALLARTPAALAASPAVRARLKAIVAGYEALLVVREQEAARVLAHLAAGGISPVLIKGAHLSHTIYPSPVLRPREDTDLVIAETEQAAVDAVLTAAGYSRSVHVRGALILGQCHYACHDRAGIVHALDVHWRLASPLVFRHVLPVAELRASRVAIPSLGVHAFGPTPRHALLIACVHLAAHHRGGDVLIWMHDLALLAEGLDGPEGDACLDAAAEAGISAVCASALDRARRYFDSPALASLARGSHTRHAGRDEPSARLLRASRPVDELWLDLRNCEGWLERMRLVGEHLCPDAEYMRATSASAGWLPLAYARRAVSGSRKWFTSGGDRRREERDAPPADSAAASVPSSPARTTR